MNSNTNVISMIVLACLLGTLPAVAQFSGGLRGQAEQSQAKVDALNKKIDALDAEIEAEIDEVVTLLSSVRDSTGTSRSGTSRGKPVRRMLVDAKEQALLGLLDTVRQSQRTLLALEGQVGKVWGMLPEEDLAQEIAILEERIDTRIDQIVAIAASLTRHEDLEQATMVKRSGSGSTQFRKRTTNPEYKLNQRVTSVSEPIRRRVAQEIATDGDRLDRKITTYQFNIDATEDPARREAMQAEQAKLKEELAQREQQFEAVASDEQPDVKTASLAEAESIQRQARDKVQDIIEKNDRKVGMLSTRDLELNRLRGYQTRLQFMGGN